MRFRSRLDALTPLLETVVLYCEFIGPTCLNLRWTHLPKRCETDRLKARVLYEIMPGVPANVWCFRGGCLVGGWSFSRMRVMGDLVCSSIRLRKLKKRRTSSASGEPGVQNIRCVMCKKSRLRWRFILSVTVPLLSRLEVSSSLKGENPNTVTLSL